MTANGKPNGRPRQSHCARGHDLDDPENVRLNTAGFRYCVPCNRIVAQQWRERKRVEGEQAEPPI